MKKTFTLAAICAMAFVSCKKDYKCSCKNQISTKDAQGTEVYYSSYNTEKTILKTSKRTAYNHCARIVYEEKDSLTTTYDYYCELK